MKIHSTILLPLIVALPLFLSSCSGGGGDDGDSVLDGDVAASINALTLTVVGDTGQNATFVFDTASDLTSTTGSEDGQFTYTADAGSEFLSIPLTGDYDYTAINQNTGVIRLSNLSLSGALPSDAIAGETYFVPDSSFSYVINLSFINPIANQFEGIGVTLSTADIFGASGPLDILQRQALTSIEGGPLPIRYRGVPPSGLDDTPNFDPGLPVTLNNLNFLLVRGNELERPSIKKEDGSRDQQGNVIGILTFTSTGPSFDGLSDTGDFTSSALADPVVTFDDAPLLLDGTYTYSRDENGASSAVLTLGPTIEIAINSFSSDAEPEGANANANGSGNIFDGSESLRGAQLFLIDDVIADFAVRTVGQTD